MEEPTWHGIELDADTAFALLEWQAEMGVDEPMLDAPVDRFDLAPTPAPSPIPLAPPSAPALTLTVRRDGDVLTATPDRDHPYALRLVGTGHVAAVDGSDDFEQRSGGVTLRAAGPLRITLPPA